MFLHLGCKSESENQAALTENKTLVFIIIIIILLLFIYIIYIIIYPGIYLLLWYNYEQVLFPSNCSSTGAFDHPAQYYKSMMMIRLIKIFKIS
jgi:hypothetical protein